MTGWGTAGTVGRDDGLCDCGEVQTMSHIADLCPATKLEGGLWSLHAADKLEVDWLTSYGT